MEICNDHEDWLHARSGRIGGSDAAAVLGCNPWMTNVQLWKYKTGKAKQKDISDKEVVKYGNNAEPLLRQLFALDFPQYEVLYEENNIFFNDKIPWAHASLDGWLVDKETGRKGILEIKTTNIIQSSQKEKWKNRIPDLIRQLTHGFIGRIDAGVVNPDIHRAKFFYCTVPQIF